MTISSHDFGQGREGLPPPTAGMFGNVIRVAPPLVITQAEVDESVAILEKVLSRLRL